MKTSAADCTPPAKILVFEPDNPPPETALKALEQGREDAAFDLLEWIDAQLSRRLK